MKLCGWQTRSMFDRYNVIDHAGLARAGTRRLADPNATERETFLLPHSFADS